MAEKYKETWYYANSKKDRKSTEHYIFRLKENDKVSSKKYGLWKLPQGMVPVLDDGTDVSSLDFIPLIVTIIRGEEHIVMAQFDEEPTDYLILAFSQRDALSRLSKHNVHLLRGINDKLYELPPPN